MPRGERGASISSCSAAPQPREEPVARRRLGTEGAGAHVSPVAGGEVPKRAACKRPTGPGRWLGPATHIGRFAIDAVRSERLTFDEVVFHRPTATRLALGEIDSTRQDVVGDR